MDQVEIQNEEPDKELIRGRLYAPDDALTGETSIRGFLW